MKLYVLPNGDAIQPESVVAVMKLDPVQLIAGGYPYRVKVELMNGIIIILSEDEADCIKTRDTIIEDINDMLDEEYYDD